MAHRRLRTLALLLILLLAVWPARAEPIYQSTKPQAAITISGIVTGPGGPAPNVWIGVGSPLDWQVVTTNSGGSYSLSIQTEGEVWFNVRPDLSTRLTQANHWRGDVTADFTQNFTLTTGYLLDVAVTAGGAPLVEPLPLEIQPLAVLPPDGWWYSLDWDDGAQRQRAVLPPDVYYLTAHDPPAGYYDTTQPFDLRSADLSADLALDTSYVHPLPYDPPVASKITVGPPDGLGEATVSGAPGAALPLARVLLVNLNSAHQAQTVSGADGSFTARIYAPPGSALMIKHGPASYRWNDLERGVSEGLNPFPGTILNLPPAHTGSEPALPFAAAGGIDLSIDDPGETLNYVGAAWALSGTVAPLAVDGEWTRVLTGTYAGESVPGLYRGGLNWTHPALADLDADGDVDLLVGERTGRLVFYRNRGSASAPDWRYETGEYAAVETGAWAYPALADVSGDGSPDLFVGAGDGRVLVFYNQGTLTPSVAASLWPSAPDEILPSVAHHIRCARRGIGRPGPGRPGRRRRPGPGGRSHRRQPHLVPQHRFSGGPRLDPRNRQLWRHRRAGRGPATGLCGPGRRRRPGPAARSLRPDGLVRAGRPRDQPHLDPPRGRPHWLWRRELQRQSRCGRLERRRRARRRERRALGRPALFREPGTAGLGRAGL